MSDRGGRALTEYRSGSLGLPGVLQSGSSQALCYVLQERMDCRQSYSMCSQGKTKHQRANSSCVCLQPKSSSPCQVSAAAWADMWASKREPEATSCTLSVPRSEHAAWRHRQLHRAATSPCLDTNKGVSFAISECSKVKKLTLVKELTLTPLFVPAASSPYRCGGDEWRAQHCRCQPDENRQRHPLPGIGTKVGQYTAVACSKQ